MRETLFDYCKRTGELELLRHDVLEDLLEEKYGGEEEDFQCFAA
mgnify:CR=1 FL=1